MARDNKDTATTVTTVTTTATKQEWQKRHEDAVQLTLAAGSAMHEAAALCVHFCQAFGGCVENVSTFAHIDSSKAREALMRVAHIRASQLESWVKAHVLRGPGAAVAAAMGRPPSEAPRYRPRPVPVPMEQSTSTVPKRRVPRRSKRKSRSRRHRKRRSKADPDTAAISLWPGVDPELEARIRDWLMEVVEVTEDTPLSGTSLGDLTSAPGSNDDVLVCLETQWQQVVAIQVEFFFMEEVEWFPDGNPTMEECRRVWHTPETTLLLFLRTLVPPQLLEVFFTKDWPEERFPLCFKRVTEMHAKAVRRYQVLTSLRRKTSGPLQPQQPPSPPPPTASPSVVRHREYQTEHIGRSTSRSSTSKSSRGTKRSRSRKSHRTKVNVVPPVSPYTRLYPCAPIPYLPMERPPPQEEDDDSSTMSEETPLEPLAQIRATEDMLRGFPCEYCSHSDHRHPL